MVNLNFKQIDLLRKRRGSSNLPDQYFIDTNKLTYIDPKFRSKNYEEGIKELILSTINLFPYSSIKIVQQQIPGCKFIKKTAI